MSFDQIAIDQALERTAGICEFPTEGTILDMSGHDADASSFFAKLGLETARIAGQGGQPDGVALIQGLPEATGLPAASLNMCALTGARAVDCNRDLLFEASRILKPQGQLVLAYTNPVSLPGTVASLTHNLALQFNPFWSPPADLFAISAHLSHFTMSGFVGGECHSFDSALAFSRENWVEYAATRPMIADANLSPAELQDFKLVLHDYIKRDFGNANFYLPFRTLTYVAYRGS